MKTSKKVIGTMLSVCVAASCVSAMSIPAAAIPATGSTYTVTIPSALTVANSGWNATSGISATGTLESGKKLTVTASSGDEFALVSGENKVGYKLATASTDTTATTSWTFDTLSNTAATKPLGIIVEDYSSKPAGTYQDTVTFTAKVEDAAITVTINQSDWGGWGRSFTKDGVTVSAGMIDPNEGNLMDGGTFSTTLGNFTKIVVTTQDCYASGTGWSGGTWAGTPASTVSFSGEFMGMGMTPTTIVCTIEPTK